MNNMYTVKNLATFRPFFLMVFKLKKQSLLCASLNPEVISVNLD